MIKRASICTAHNLSCSGTGPSGLARITATTHPQPLLASTQELSRAGSRWVGRVGKKRLGGRPHNSARSLRQVRAWVTDNHSCPTLPPPLGSHRRRGRAPNYLGKEGRERATNPGGSEKRLVTARTVGRAGGDGSLRF